MAAYYNEIDPYAAAWLRRLIAAGHIAAGVVDERSIEDIYPAELREFSQCHFFAGIGVWSWALRTAGWPDDRPVWTGSCPCQPFSAAGKGAGFADERHLWPAFHHLISECRPPVVFGEQVASKDGLNWLDLVRTDLEATGYAVGASDLCAAGIGAPHIRQRLWWVADAGCQQHARRHGDASDHDQRGGTRVEPGREPSPRGPVHGLADAREAGLDQFSPSRLHERRPGKGSGESTQGSADGSFGHDTAGRIAHGGLGYTNGSRASIGIPEPLEWQAGQSEVDDDRGHRLFRSGAGRPKFYGVENGARPSPTHGFWGDADWLFCRDGKWRPVEPGTFPLAHGAPARVGRLRAYGNAIVPQVAETFIRAYLDIRG